MATMAVRVSQTTVAMLLFLLIAATLVPNCQLEAAKDGNERYMVKSPILGVDIEHCKVVYPAKDKVEKRYIVKPTRRTLEEDVLDAHYQRDRWPGDDRGPGDRDRGPGDDRGPGGRDRGPGDDRRPGDNGGPGDDRGPGYNRGPGDGRGPGDHDRGPGDDRGPGHDRDPGRDRGRRPGFPHAADVTIAGSVFCSRCNELDSTPMFGTETVLLCPHPPPGNDSHRARDPLLYVSSALTAKDGSFRFRVNSTFGNILDRCLVTIIPGSDSNCDLPPHSGHSVPMSTLKSYTRTVADTGDLVYAIPSLSFHPSTRPLSCSSSSGTPNGRRNLLNSQLDQPSNTEHYHRDGKDQTIATFHQPKSSHMSRFIGNEHPNKAQCATTMASLIPRVSNRRLTAIDVAKSISKRLSLITVNIPPIPEIPKIPDIPPIPAIPQIPPIPKVPSSSSSINP